VQPVALQHAPLGGKKINQEPARIRRRARRRRGDGGRPDRIRRRAERAMDPRVINADDLEREPSLQLSQRHCRRRLGIEIAAFAHVREM
jgi:hypothetical protein